ncbi:MAG: MlaD family protein [Thermodesulfobacteriota bacterium]
MSKKASPTLIGIFVIGAIVLAIAAVVIFGSGKIFRKTYTYVAFFEGSVVGLNVGAPVLLRGVQIGTVKDIRLDFIPKKKDFEVAVLLEYEPSRITKGSEHIDPVKHFKKLLDNGLAAQLQLQSMVTGQLMVSLDYYPDKTRSDTIGSYPEYTQIPTIKTTVEELTKTLQNIPFEEIMDSLNSTVKKLEEILSEDSAPRTEFMRAMEEVTDASRSIRRLADYLEQHPEAIIKGKRER